MTYQTEEELAAEKAMKPRPDLVPPRAIMAGGRAMAYGFGKHGGGTTGRGTYRDADHRQSLVTEHIASFERHWLRARIGIDAGVKAIDPGTGLAELDCAMAQLAIVIDLTEDPPTRTAEGTDE